MIACGDWKETIYKRYLTSPETLPELRKLEIHMQSIDIKSSAPLKNSQITIFKH